MEYKKMLISCLDEYFKNNPEPNEKKAYEIGYEKMGGLISKLKFLNREAVVEAKEIFQNSYFTKESFNNAVNTIKEMIYYDDFEESFGLKKGFYVIYKYEGEKIKSIMASTDLSKVPKTLKPYKIKEIIPSVEDLRISLEIALEAKISKMFH